VHVSLRESLQSCHISRGFSSKQRHFGHTQRQTVGLFAHDAARLRRNPARRSALEKKIVASDEFPERALSELV